MLLIPPWVNVASRDNGEQAARDERNLVIRVVPIDTPSLGDRSYLAHDGEVAVVVDPQRDIDRVLDLAGREGVRIAVVAETHIHNDYVTGGLALARATGASYLVNADDPVTFERTPVRDGDVVGVSDRLAVRVLATPGHTHTHLSYALHADDEVAGIFTGGSLLYGSTGRPDLLGPDHTPRLVRAQWASARRLAGELADETPVFPTHGFGSFCSSSQNDDVAASTIGAEKRSNPALTLDENRYVEQLLAGLDAYPSYYAHMSPANLAGPAPAELAPPAPADAAELRRRLAAGEWLVDLRSRTAFGAGHAPGTINIGLDGAMATYLGWLRPWGTPVTLLGDSVEQVAEAQRELVRIGIDKPSAVGVGDPSEWTTDGTLDTVEHRRFTDVATAWPARGFVILDVRRNDERAKSYLADSIHVPIHELPARLDELPDEPLWVHCATGYRASTAVSLIKRTGRRVALIDDDWDNAEPAGLPIKRPGAAG